MSVKKWCKWPHHANGSSVAFLAVLNHVLEPCWKLFVRNLVLSHVLSAKKAQNKGVIFFISFSLYTDHLNFFPACGCLHGFQTLTSSDQDVKIHGCSFGNYLWVVLACLVGIFPVFLLTLCLESPLLWRGFLVVQTVVSPVCSLTEVWRHWLCCLDLKTGIEMLLWRDKVFLCRNSCKTS